MGRFYPNRAFYHEQGDDVAKSMLLHSIGSPLGEDGLYWLSMHGSNVWGNDKVALDDRVQFVQDHWAEFVGYAVDPYKETGWMKADKPLSFLAFCYEIKLLQEWIDAGYQQEDFVTNLVCYIDG